MRTVKCFRKLVLVLLSLQKSIYNSCLRINHKVILIRSSHVLKPFDFAVLNAQKYD